jgi:translation initiation factor 2 alpha subunit (eIF-2alpha)
MSIEKSKSDKMIRKEDEKVEVETKTLTAFFFPDYQITIQAENREEAEKKLLEIINKK